METTSTLPAEDKGTTWRVHVYEANRALVERGVGGGVRERDPCDASAIDVILWTAALDVSTECKEGINAIHVTTMGRR